MHYTNVLGSSIKVILSAKVQNYVLELSWCTFRSKLEQANMHCYENKNNDLLQLQQSSTIQPFKLHRLPSPHWNSLIGLYKISSSHNY